MATKKQKTQQVLSWKLRMVMGAKGTTFPREREIPIHIRQKLYLIQHELIAVELLLVTALRNIP